MLTVWLPVRDRVTLTSGVLMSWPVVRFHAGTSFHSANQWEPSLFCNKYDRTVLGAPVREYSSGVSDAAPVSASKSITFFNER